MRTPILIKLFVPKFDRVCDIDIEQEQFFRTQYGAYTPGELPPSATTSDEDEERRQKEALLSGAADALLNGADPVNVAAAAGVEAIADPTSPSSPAGDSQSPTTEKQKAEKAKPRNG